MSALALRDKSRFDEAIRELQSALQGELPNPAEAHFQLGLIADQTGQEDWAISEWREVEKLQPDHLYAHMSLAVALQNRGDKKAALEEWRRAHEISPDNASITASYEALAKQVQP